MSIIILQTPTSIVSRKVELKKNFWDFSGFKPKKNLLWGRCGYFLAQYNHCQYKLVWKLGTFYLLQSLQCANIVFQLTESQGEQHQDSTQKGVYHSNFCTHCFQDFVWQTLSFFDGAFPTVQSQNFPATVQLVLDRWSSCHQVGSGALWVLVLDKI